MILIGSSLPIENVCAFVLDLAAVCSASWRLCSLCVCAFMLCPVLGARIWCSARFVLVRAVLDVSDLLMRSLVCAVVYRLNE